MSKPFPSVATLVPFLVTSAAPRAQEPEPGPLVELVDAFPAQDKFDRPLHVDWHADDPDHYWVVEQTGKVLRVPRDGQERDRSVLLDLGEQCLHPRNGGHNEEGLLGFAFDPDHAKNRSVYVYYSRKTGGQGRRIGRESVVSRMVVRDGFAGPLIDPATELVILRVDQPWGNHNGGTIVFGPDRMLYIALGDGGARADMGGNGQNKATLLASILRIDVRNADRDQPYSLPADNPFVEGADGDETARPEIWAYGLRNPWRIAFDRETGDLWCADVGQDAYEEVGRIVAGGNYGWPIREAFHEFPPGRDDSDDPEGLLPPIAEYPRKDGISVTGGHVYRGERIPELAGRYVYGDYVFRTMWAVREDRSGEGEHDVIEIGKAPAPLASFAEEPDGEHLAMCFDGRIYRLVPGGDRSR